MKRFLIGLAFLAGVIVALALVRTEISTDAAALRIAGVLIPFGNRTPLVSADASIRLFPRLAVVFQNVRFAVSDGATLDKPDLTADRITADVDLLPLFIGQTSVSRFVLDRPQLRLTTTFDLAGLTPDRRVLTRMLPASVVVHNGTIRFETPDLMREDVVSGIDARMRWPRALGNLSLDGTAVWRGERIGLSLQGIAPPRLASGEPGDIDVTFDTPSLHVSYAGRTLLSDKLQLDGLFSAAIDDPRRLGDGGDGGSGTSSLPPIDIAGHLRSQGWTASLSEARLKIGSATADGVLSTRLDAVRPQLRGTLAIGDIDLTPALAAAGEPAWLDWTPDPFLLAGLDIDLRLSIAEARVGTTQISNLAASLLVADGQLHGEIGDASLLGGTGSMLVRGTVDAGGVKASGRMSLTGAPVSVLRKQLSLQALPPLAGNVSWSGEFETSGTTLRTTLARLGGHATCEAPLLVLEGPAAPMVALVATKSALLQAASARLGINPEIEHLACALTFAGSALTVQHIDFAMAGLVFDLAGSVGLKDRMLVLDGAARQEAPTATLATTVPVHVVGTLDHPIATVGEDTPVAGAAPDAPAPIPPPQLPN